MNTILWTPSSPKSTQMWHFLSSIEKKYKLTLADYHQLHTWTLENPAQFWQELCNFYNICFDSPPVEIFNNPQEMIQAKWFQGAQFNFAEKLLSREDEHIAIISINEEGKRDTLSYRQLKTQVAECAAGLRSRGIQKGDRVAGVLPNIAETIIAMLATTSLGAIWSSCSPEFGVQSLLDRLGQIQPKLLFIGDGHCYQGKKYSDQGKIHQIGAALSSLVEIVVCPILQEPLTKNINKPVSYWKEFKRPNEPLEFISCPFDHPVYILFSSGTTGKPKCIVHSAGGTLLQHIKELGLHTDISEKDNLLFYTTCGWMMWNWMVSVLALGGTLTLYEGSPTYPKPKRLFQIVEDEKVSVFGTSAKFISSIEKTGYKPNQEFSLPQLRCILSTGSPLLPKNFDFVYEHIQAQLQLSSISGGTDIVSCFALGNPILPVYRGELQSAGLGMAVEVFDEQGHAVYQTRGELVCTKPFPAMPIGFWNDPEKIKYKQAYFERFPGIWAHGDFAEHTTNNGFILYGRSDTVLNPGGVRIGTAEIYRQVEKIPEVIDSVVIGQDWQDDVRIVLFVKLQDGFVLDEALCKSIRQILRENASPRHVPAKIIQVLDIPRTLSGKIVEVAVRQVVHGQKVNNMESLANPEALDYFKNREELLG